MFVLWSNRWCEQFMCWWNTTRNIKRDKRRENSSFQWKSLVTSFKAPKQSCSSFSFSWVHWGPRNELPSCVPYWVSQQISRIGYCRSQRATVWLIQNRTPFPQDSNACIRSTTTWSLCISCHWTRKDLHWTSAWRLYRVHFTCYSLHRDWELSWSHSFIETMV